MIPFSRRLLPAPRLLAAIVAKEVKERELHDTSLKDLKEVQTVLLLNASHT